MVEDTVSLPMPDCISLHLHRMNKCLPLILYRNISGSSVLMGAATLRSLDVSFAMPFCFLGTSLFRQSCVSPVIYALPPDGARKAPFEACRRIASN